MKPVTDVQKMEQAQVLLREAGVIWMFWTAEDIRDMIEAKLSEVGLSLPVDAVMLNIHCTHLSNDDDELSLWIAVEDAIAAVARDKLGG